MQERASAPGRRIEEIIASFEKASMDNSNDTPMEYSNDAAMEEGSVDGEEWMEEGGALLDAEMGMRQKEMAESAGGRGGGGERGGEGAEVRGGQRVGVFKS